MMEARKILIHGEWIDSSSHELIDVVNPSTGCIIAKIPNCGESDVEDTVQSSIIGFKIWRTTPAEKRAAIIHTAANLLRQNAKKVASEITSEMGKPPKSALCEVYDAADVFDFFAEEGLRIKGDIYQHNHANEQVQVVKEPVGIVVSITAANYPVALLSWKLGAALACGCSVIAKPDECSTTAAFSIGHLFLEAGLPAGVLNILSGTGRTGELLVQHPNVNKIAFTGSVATGKKVAAVAAGTCKRVSLELGGQCPAIITDGIIPAEIIDKFIYQTFKNSGQHCYRINRAYVHTNIYDEFVRLLVDRLQKMSIDKDDESAVHQGPLYHKKIFDHAIEQIDDATKKGAIILTGGKQMPSEPNTYYIEPTILTNATHEMLFMKDESFAPILAIMKVVSLSEAISYANDSIYGLASYVYTPDTGLGLQVARQLETGVVWVNQIHKAYSFAPFGGMKQSGYGREKSAYGLDEYLETKTVYLALPSLD